VIRRQLILALAILGASSSLRSEEADDILLQARLSPTRSPATLRAQIRSEEKTSPLLINLKDHVISYEFRDPDQALLLKLRPESTLLLEKKNGRTLPIAQSRLHDQIRDTGVSYQDLSLGFLYWPHPHLQGEETVKTRLHDQIRDTGVSYQDLSLGFLYWPHPHLQGEETVKTRPCWKIDLQAPAGELVYGVTLIWIDKESGAILRIEGYDKKGLLIRRFEIVSAQKIDGLWILKQMRIESFPPGDSSPTSRVYLEVLGKD